MDRQSYTREILCTQRRLSGTIDASQKSLNPSVDLVLHARNANRRRSQERPDLWSFWRGQRYGFGC